MVDLTEYVEVTHKIKFKSRLPRKQYYEGMTEEEITGHVSDQANVVESIIFAFETDDSDDMITTKVKFTSEIDEELEEE